MTQSDKQKKTKLKYKKQNEIVRERRSKLIAMTHGVCKDCRMGFGDFMFDFHHKDPKTKKFNLTGKNLTRKWDDVLEEFKKCVLLCPNCHRIRHWKMDNEKG